MMSDHSGLKHFFDQSNVNYNQARWLATLVSFTSRSDTSKGM